MPKVKVFYLFLRNYNQKKTSTFSRFIPPASLVVWAEFKGEESIFPPLAGGIEGGG